MRHPARVRRVYHGLQPPNTAGLEREGQRIRADLGVGPDDFLVGNVGPSAGGVMYGPCCATKSYTNWAIEILPFLE